MDSTVKSLLPLYEAKPNFRRWKRWFCSSREEFPKVKDRKSTSIVMFSVGIAFFVLRRFSVYEHIRHFLYRPSSKNIRHRVPASFTDWYIIMRLSVVILLWLNLPPSGPKAISVILLFLILQKVQQNFYVLYWRYNTRMGDHQFHAHNHIRNLILAFVAYAEIIILYGIIYWNSFAFEVGLINVFEALYLSLVVGMTFNIENNMDSNVLSAVFSSEIVISIVMITTIITRSLSNMLPAKEH